MTHLFHVPRATMHVTADAVRVPNKPHAASVAQPNCRLSMKRMNEMRKTMAFHRARSAHMLHHYRIGLHVALQELCALHPSSSPFVIRLKHIGCSRPTPLGTPLTNRERFQIQPPMRLSHRHQPRPTPRRAYPLRHPVPIPTSPPTILRPHRAAVPSASNIIRVASRRQGSLRPASPATHVSAGSSPP